MAVDLDVMAKMEADSKLALADFNNMTDDEVKKVRAWWNKWYLKAGHKRLAYILMGKTR